LDQNARWLETFPLFPPFLFKMPWRGARHSKRIVFLRPFPKLPLC